MILRDQREELDTILYWCHLITDCKVWLKVHWENFLEKKIGSENVYFFKRVRFGEKTEKSNSSFYQPEKNYPHPPTTQSHTVGSLYPKIFVRRKKILEVGENVEITKKWQEEAKKWHLFFWSEFWVQTSQSGRLLYKYSLLDWSNTT